ncbi:BgTH12-07473 [Blumeria graminis f. sp. triticale]|uniref:BgTH12-07473 n=3 Tax=Blumeria graminis TaxID=34373 RepID=A0A9W4CXB8_BLUGR|nr:BgTH12-07473 [Blumeria graminis f. sp. triticale]
MSTMHHVAFQKKATQAHCFNYATSSFSPAQSSKSNSLAIADLLQHDPALHQLSLSHEKSPSLKEHYTQSSINSVPLTSCVDSFHSNLSSVSTVQNATTTKYTDSFENKELSGPSLNSMDDPDVRLAAEALEDLRADFIGSPAQKNRTPSLLLPKIAAQNNHQPEPLLSLLTTSHPFIRNAIGGSISAYSASKNYSPRIKSSVEYVERRFTPVVNTVGSVGRLTGVEDGVRWILGARKEGYELPAIVEKDDESPYKRRKLHEEVGSGTNSRRDLDSNHRQDNKLWRESKKSSNIETSPTPCELQSPGHGVRQSSVTDDSQKISSTTENSWPTRLALSTSGLSVAMSEESLRSLKYCLSWLRWANEHIGKMVLALKSALEQYDGKKDSDISRHKAEGSLGSNFDAERRVLCGTITELKNDVLKTLKEMVDIVSKYAGGALPENARTLVRRHLTSLPQRFRMASNKPSEGIKNDHNSENNCVDGGRRVLVLAKEGLDMMGQVSGVLGGTIMSAENWCERFGRSKSEIRESGPNESLKDHA